MGRKKIVKYSFPEGGSQTSNLKDALQLLELEGAAKALVGINKIAIEKKISYLDFLESLIDEEFAKKEDMRIERWKKQAKFPWMKTINEYDFNYPDKIDKAKILQLVECSWIDNGGKVIFFGPSGVGKTHLSIGLGLEAIQRSYETKFVTCNRLTEAIDVAISKDKEQGGGKNRENLLNSFTSVPLLILDEFAYNRVTPEVSNVLFEIIHRRHEAQKSIILTANEAFDKWKIFEDETRAAAAIDRLMEDGFPIIIEGESYRHRKYNNEINNKEKKDE